METPADLDMLRVYVGAFRKRAKAFERHARSMAQESAELERVLADHVDAQPDEEAERNEQHHHGVVPAHRIGEYTPAA